MYPELKNIRDLKYYKISQDNPLMVKLEKCKKDKLYHYTNKKGAEGILGTNSLWVTHSDFLDDTSEIKYISLVLEGVINYLSDPDCYMLYDLGFRWQYNIFNAILETLRALREIYQKGAPISGGSLFLLSLTENCNNKYLIENYSGKGGAVFEFFKDISFKNTKGIISVFSAKVVYDLKKQIILILEDINEFYLELINNVSFANEKEVDYLEIVDTVKSIIYTKIINYSFFFKNAKYDKEEEYRMVFLLGETYNNLIKYRVKDNRNIPYIQMNLDEKVMLNKICT